jgi:hypothetical protein
MTSMPESDERDRAETRVFVDRLEDGVAVVVVDEDREVILPRHVLPADAIEGTWLILRLTVDTQETEDRRRAVADRRRRLGATDDGGDFEL